MIREILENHKSNSQNDDILDTRQRKRVAWKTGTSYGFRDAWALGTTPQYTVGVWVGRPDGTPMPGQYGAITALPLMYEVFDSLPKPDHVVLRTEMPKEVKAIDICWPLGRSVQETQAGLCHRQRKGFALINSVPPTWPDRDARIWNAGQLELQIDAQTGLRLSADCKQAHSQKTLHIARWPSLTTPWLPISLREKTRIPALAADCNEDTLASMETLQIDGPAEKSTLARAPNSTQPISAEFRALGTQQKVKWLVNGQWVADTQAGQKILMKFDTAGVHRITAMTDAGAWDEMSLYVLK